MSVATTVHESSLLLTLEEISQLISHSHNPHETLGNIVRLIQGRFCTDVSSVYLLEPESGELVLAATVGLDQSGVGRVRMRLDEGLTGLVAERMSPIMEPDASVHPRFKYFPEAGEDPYHSFLGVPLIESGIVQGVLVVQTMERRPFSPNEIRMLVTVGSQLAPLVSGARMLDRVASADVDAREAVATAEELRTPRWLSGCPLSPGTGCGQAYLNGQNGILGEIPDSVATDPAVEHQRLNRAMDAAREEITRLSRRISHLVGEDHGAILQAQLMILQDSTVERDLAGCLAATVGKERLVLVAQEASVLDLFSVDLDHLVGVVVEHGGPHSHAVIIARSLGIPMIGQVPGLFDQFKAGQLLRINGTTGQIVLDPSADDDGGEASPSIVQVHRNGEGSATFADRPGMPRIEANVNLLSEAARVLASGASGVGLYRTEMLFLARRTLPTEEEQVEIYRKLIDALKGRPATIRTFDLRPDKLAHGSTAAASMAQTLDWRLVLESPILQRLFKEQVRAIFRAAATGPVRLLIPLVTRSRLLEFAIATVEQARQELLREDLEFGRDVPLGVMIEVAAVAPLIDAWSDRVDFFSLGTNDLIASALGINRDDPVGTLGDDILHPGLIRMIGDMIASAHRAGRPVSVCGEMAADPEGAIALVALGADSLSLAVDRVASIRQLMSRLDAESLAALGTKLHEARTVDEVRALITAIAGPAKPQGSCAGRAEVVVPQP